MLAPHRSLEECGGTTAFPLLVPVYPNHPEAGEMKEVRHFLSRTNIPTLVAYSQPSLLPFISQGDFVVGNRQVFYSSLMHSAKDVFRIKDGGHLIMYDQPAAVAQLILQFQTKYRAFQ
ncbi:uncharacterized protein LOC111706126 [Eurytemora carolleeae]|uniref:uncharacterized protein LOC111706126 n=1 Tax=Eurytemora carolleeae TaxID=1294199 RepID=UPI000C78CA9F|nr:uncharacterized protein LOC111706126 [Eurytemora carolleeae]|eukprot:XP_023334669.1 uncharacterized protein LOC111706126 [Eurytemora affinis]